MLKNLPVPEKCHNLAQSIDIKAKAKGFQVVNDCSNNLEHLFRFGWVEVGWRESCGCTDPTMKSYREWERVVKLLKKMGYTIREERIKHDCAWVTLARGFWHSMKYFIEAEPAKGNGK